MADPEDLKKPSNAIKVQTDEFLGTASAGLLRAVRVPPETASIIVSVFDSGGSPMGFRIQGTGDDGDPVVDGSRWQAGAKWIYTIGREDPSRGRVEAVSWLFYVSGDGANPTIQVESSFHGQG